MLTACAQEKIKAGAIKMRRIFKAYRELLGIIYSERPFIIILSIAVAILSGVLNPIFVWVFG